MKGLSKIKALLIDLSGTIHIDNEAIPGAVQAVQLLREHKIPFQFVTNTTKESQIRLCHRLNKLGFDVTSQEIYSSLSAAKRLIVSQELRPMLLLEEEALEDFQDVSTDNPNAVVIGLAPSKFNYNTLTEAFNLVLGGASLIAIHKARYFRTSAGLALGPGFVTGLEYSTGEKAVVVGKPEKEFFRSALEHLKGRNVSLNSLRLEDTLMIGDDVKDDINGAQEAGLKGALVKTGKYSDGDEEKVAQPPDLVFDSFPKLIEEYLSSNS
ncbi:haloacid dehalogenase-like hydrolase domain-containing protein 2 isoform X2 [Tigriopus californicus]|uniref:haloacid dehalogenase-like hydrolase domain-containing protein 2 isoform X2 n=1 Tax=Tigriopus californicus TaxID=6832 RepID=UPI0027DAA4BD|nr:haloacid dehalogenase-like hydrolase domain-containing protein 2 isoform X2 [Tigriopus californicus]